MRRRKFEVIVYRISNWRMNLVGDVQPSFKALRNKRRMVEKGREKRGAIQMRTAQLSSRKINPRDQVTPIKMSLFLSKKSGRLFWKDDGIQSK